MGRVVIFGVYGRPVPKGRPRVTRHGTYTPKSTQVFESAIRAAWLEKGEKLHLTPYLKRGDIDNIIKAVLDALNGCAYKDDSAVFRVCGRKFYTDGEPFTEVTICSVEVDHEL